MVVTLVFSSHSGELREITSDLKMRTIVIPPIRSVLLCKTALNALFELPFFKVPKCEIFVSGGMGSNTGVKPSVSQQVIQTRVEQAKPKTVEAVVVPITGGRVVGGTITGNFTQSSRTGPEMVKPPFVVGGVQMGGVVVEKGSIPAGGVRSEQNVNIIRTVKSPEIPAKEQMITQEFVDVSGQRRIPISGGTEFNIVRKTVPAKKDQNAPQWIPERIAPRGAAAKGVSGQAVEGEIVGIRVPSSHAGMISGATVLGNTGVREVPVMNVGPRLRIKEIVQEVNPVSFSTEAKDSGGGTVVETQRRIQSRLVPGQTTGTFSKTVGVQGGGGAGGAARFEGAASGATGGWSLSGEGSGARFGSGSGMSGRAGGVTGVAGRTVEILPSGTGLAGGDFTQMGKVFGTGGGVKRVIDTNMKRVPAGAVQMETEGGVNLASLGLGGAEGSNIIRRTVQLSGGEGRSGSSTGGAMFSSSGGNFIDPGTAGGSTGGEFISQRTITGGGSTGSNNLNDLMFLTSAENLLEGFGGKKRRRRSTSSRSRSKRSVNKQVYQALVTNCQGQGVQGPSIMVVANQGEVQFALKTTDFEQPGIVVVPAVSAILKEPK